MTAGKMLSCIISKTQSADQVEQYRGRKECEGVRRKKREKKKNLASVLTFEQTFELVLEYFYVLQQKSIHNNAAQ